MLYNFSKVFDLIVLKFCFEFDFQTWVRKFGTRSTISSRRDIASEVIKGHLSCIVFNDNDARMAYFKIQVFYDADSLKKHHPLLISTNRGIRPCQDKGEIIILDS